MQQIPEVFKNMKSVILSKLTEKYSYDDEGVDEWHMRRRNFCYGYCAVFKIGRKLGLASITDVVSMVAQPKGNMFWTFVSAKIL